MIEQTVLEQPTREDWADWKWQMRHRIRTAEQLQHYVDPTEDELRAIAETRDVFRFAITPYYASLMDPDNPDCGIRRQVVPRGGEILGDVAGVVDPLEEVAHSPVKNLIHNYRDRVAFCISAECAIYCRYCLRKRMVGDAEHFMRKNELQEAIDYIAAHAEIRDVLLTGGDPLSFGDAGLEWLLQRLRDIKHVEVIRIGSRMPVKLPYRITQELCDMLQSYHPIWLNTHFNHPRELTDDAAIAIDRLLRAGIPVGNQTVLLAGINDRLETMMELCEGLVRMRVRPYYLYQAQLIGGTAHLRTSIETGMSIMSEMQGVTTGFAIPRYMLDTPYGKVPLTRDYVFGRAGDHVVMRTTRGRIWAEPNPAPTEEFLRDLLPAVDMPADAATMTENAGPPVVDFPHMCE